jgi:hypothetical protein
VAKGELVILIGLEAFQARLDDQQLVGAADVCRGQPLVQLVHRSAEQEVQQPRDGGLAKVVRVKNKEAAPVDRVWR